MIDPGPSNERNGSPTRFCTVRHAGEADIPGILECLQSAFEPYRPEYTMEAYLDTVLTFQGARDRLATMTILAAVDQWDRIVGTLAFRRESETTGHLRGMAVDPVLQGKGVAQSLLEQALRELAGLGCSRVTLKTTSPLRRAIRFYEKNGFRKSGKVSDFFGMTATEYFLELHPATDQGDVPRPIAFSSEDDEAQRPKGAAY